MSARNRHFIVGDCYMNAIYNKDRPNRGGFLKMLPFVLTTQQSALDQVDHDHLIREKIYMDSPKESMKTKKAKSGWINLVTSDFGRLAVK